MKNIIHAQNCPLCGSEPRCEAVEESENVSSARIYCRCGLEVNDLVEGADPYRALEVVKRKWDRLCAKEDAE